MAGKPKAKLSPEAQTYAVQALACFDTPTVVAEAIRKEFGVSIAPQSVEAYDPTKRAGAKLSKRWKALFEETRATFLKDTSEIAISHRAVRLRAIQRMAQKAESQGNMSLAAQLHEQAAKEMGNHYTNKHRLEHTGRDGGPIQSVDLSKLTGDDLDQLERIFSPLARSGDDAAPDQSGEEPATG